MNEIKESSGCRPYFFDIVILVSIALILGIYLIATTVVITEDGAEYIRYTQWMQDDLPGVLADRPSGYEVLILLGYRMFHAVTGNSSVQGLIWVAQGITLLCRVLAIVPLYLIGRLLVNSKSSFWGCIILLLLPDPAQWGSNVLREWPNLLFMALSLLYFLHGMKKNKIRGFLLSGFFSGWSFYVRFESIACLTALTVMILVVLIFRSSTKEQRLKWILGIVLMGIGLSVPALIYNHYSGQLIPNNLKKYLSPTAKPDTSDSAIDAPGNHLISSSSEDCIELNTAVSSMAHLNEKTVTKHNKSTSGKLSRIYIAAYELIKDIGELFMWFFFPFWIIGLFCGLKINKDFVNRFIVIGVILTGVVLILIRYHFKEETITQRWNLPMIALTAAYIHFGVEQFGRWVNRKKTPNHKSIETWVKVLITIGVLICLFRCFEPLGLGNEVYSKAAKWINENTDPNDIFYTSDNRIPIYADRPIFHDHDQIGNLLKEGEYIIVLTGDEDVILPEDVTMEAEFPAEADWQKELSIYRYEQ